MSDQSTPSPSRTMVAWCPDWPIHGIVRAEGLSLYDPIALVEKGEIFACSEAARKDGVRRGLRLREAQARCPDLQVFPYDSSLDARSFEPVLEGIEEIMPGVQVLRPGTCAIRAKGPTRYYGTELEAAAELLQCLGELGISDARIGIADGPFAAEQAARLAADSVLIIPQGESPSFLAPMPVSVLGIPQIATLLRRLGIRRCGEFAVLTATDVRARFGEDGARAHVLASGLDGRTVIPRLPPEDFDAQVEFEPPLDRIDQVTFGFRASADRFLERLSATGLVCTALRIEVTTENGEHSDRSWLHPRSFTAAEVVDRVRWQLQGTGSIESGLKSSICRVRVTPESVDAASSHEEGLWGGGPDERIHHSLSRVQSMLGHEGVLTATVGGGRMLADRRVLVAWGDRAQPERPSDRPWPGSLPGLAPASVFTERRIVQVIAPNGEQVGVDDRGIVTGPISGFAPSNVTATKEVTAWAGPWPVEERWWDPEHRRRLHRFQLVDADGIAWLVVLEKGVWWAEARYD
jgi:protein ImuB